MLGDTSMSKRDDPALTELHSTGVSSWCFLELVYKIIDCGILFVLPLPQNSKLSEGRDQIHLFILVALGYKSLFGI